MLGVCPFVCQRGNAPPLHPEISGLSALLSFRTQGPELSEEGALSRVLAVKAVLWGPLKNEV